MLLRADNTEYRVGDAGLWVTRSDTLIGPDGNISPAALSYRTVEVIVLEEDLEVALTTAEDLNGRFTEAYVYMHRPPSSTSVLIDEINVRNAVAELGLDEYYPAPQLVRFGNYVYVFSGVEQGEQQYIDLSDIDDATVMPWGGTYWENFKGDSENGQTGTALKLECEWCVGMINEDGASLNHQVAFIRDRKESDTEYTYRQSALNAHLRDGPGHAVDAPREGYQHNRGHLYPSNYTAPDTVSEADMKNYDVWLTEWDDVNKIESSFSSDIQFLEYEPRHYNVRGDNYHLQYARTVNYVTDDTNTVHRLFQSRIGRAWGTSSFDWSGTAPLLQWPDTDLSSSSKYSSGGDLLLLKIQKSDIQSSTTHIKVYMSRRGGSFPEGAQVNNRDLFIGTPTPAPSATSFQGFEVTTGDAFFINLPPDEPGIPVLPYAAGFLEGNTSDGSTRDLSNITSVNPWLLGNAFIYVGKPQNVFEALGSDRFPVINVVAGGSDVLVVPRNVPPPRATFGCVFNNSLVTNDLDNDGLVRWSVADIPGSFPAAYLYDLNDPFVSVRNMGRYMLIMGKNKTVLSRYLVYEDVSPENIQGAFLEIDDNRGALRHGLTAPFTHPSMGPCVAFVSNDGQLWVTNGNTPKMLTPQFDWADVNMADAWLVDNPAKQRLELHTNSGAIDDRVPVSDSYYTLSYHEGHLLGQFIPSVMGPHDHKATMYAVGGGISASYVCDGNLYTVGTGSEGAGVPYILTSVINPAGLDREFMVYAMRTAYREVAGTLTQRVLGYDRGQQTFNSGDMDITDPDSPGIFHFSVQQGHSGMQLEIQGFDFGCVDAVEFDVDEGLGPLSA